MNIKEAIDLIQSKKCQEAAIAFKVNDSITEYLPCEKPAVAVVANRDSQPYYMCDQCTDHNVRNRGATILVKV